jgi:NADPH-dependent 2,4-dienoyl-CoA reductase/sulfur reductase-like enzyme/rhodanese-related sulfurtransferase
MERPRILILGGVAGGASAAARARRLLEDAEIVIFERGPYASYANCGLPYYLGGEIADRGKLLVADGNRLQGWLNLDVRTGCEVQAIDRAAKHVEVRELATGRVEQERYDYLILAPGAAPIRPAPLLAEVGADHPRVLSLRSIPDVDQIKAVVDAGARNVVVIGGGFIGLEVTEQLVHRGATVRLVEMLPQVMPPLDAEMVAPIQELLRAKGVELHLGDGVAGLTPFDGQRVRVRLQSGTALDADLVLLAIGVKPETSLGAAAGLELNERGALRVDGYLRTSDPAIYAVGDAVEVDEPILGGKTQIPLAGPANRQGRLAADHLAAELGRTLWPDGAPRYRGSQGTSVVRVFNAAAAMTGLSEKALARAGKKLHEDFEVVYVHPFHHADYYPGAQRMTLKLLFERPTGRVLGAQAVGGEGVDKRIDVLAMAIQMRATVFDLEQAELCYAPQFGSAKDPVNQAGFQATNVLRGVTQVVTAKELANLINDTPGGSVTVLDVRAKSEYAAGHVPGAVNVPIEELRSRLDDVPKQKPVVTYCAVGQRGYISERILKQHGWNDIRNLSGGFRSWQQFYPENVAQ